MEIILIHRPRGLLPPELVKASIELGKELNVKTEKAVPGGKLVASYAACGQMCIFCVWDVPRVDNLMPLCGQMTWLGWDTEVIPVQKMKDALPAMEKALAEMAKK